METVFEPSADHAWIIHEYGCDAQRESGIESRFSIGNGFFGVRGMPTIYSDHIGDSSSPRTYVAGLFDTPNTLPLIPALVPAPDWVGVTILVNGEPLLRPGDMVSERTLDMSRGTLLSTWHPPGSDGVVVRLRSLRLVSLADRATGLQLLRIDFGVAAPITLEVSCAVSGSALMPTFLGGDLGVWRTMKSEKSLAMATAAALELDGRKLKPSEVGELKFQWHWKSAPGQIVYFQRVVAFA
jgi:Glycosyl hydrolase family 65, N-terminal domain